MQNHNNKETLHKGWKLQAELFFIALFPNGWKFVIECHPQDIVINGFISICIGLDVWYGCLGYMWVMVGKHQEPFVYGGILCFQFYRKNKSPPFTHSDNKS